LLLFELINAVQTTSSIDAASNLTGGKTKSKNIDKTVSDQIASAKLLDKQASRLLKELF